MGKSRSSSFKCNFDMSVSFAHKAFELIRAAVGTFHRKDMGRIVAPGVVTGKFGNGHDLYRIHPEFDQVIEPAQHRVEITGFTLLIHIKGTDVHFIDDKFVVRRRGEGITLPVTGGVIVYYPLAHRVGHLTGIGVDAFQFLLVVFEQKLVLLPGLGARDIGVPVAVLLAAQGMFGSGPVVETPHDKDLLRMRRPNAEGRAVLVGDGPHAGPVHFLSCCCFHVSLH